MPAIWPKLELNDWQLMKDPGHPWDDGGFRVGPDILRLYVTDTGGWPGFVLWDGNGAPPVQVLPHAYWFVEDDWINKAEPGNHVDHPPATLIAMPNGSLNHILAVDIEDDQGNVVHLAMVAQFKA